MKIKETINELKILFILPFLDVFSTFLFVRKYGIEQESNPIGVLFLSNFGIFAYPLLFLFAIIFLILSSQICLYLISKEYNWRRNFYLKKGILKENHLNNAKNILKGGWLGCYAVVISLNLGIIG